MTYGHFPSFSIYNGLFDLQFNSIVQIHYDQTYLYLQRHLEIIDMADSSEIH